MVLGRGGYVFTLITTAMMMLTLSLLIFQGQISSPRFEDSTKKMNLNELHFFVESVKNDASRAVSISGQRSLAYAVNHIADTNEAFDGYDMANCTDFKREDTGVEAAISELIVCGTLDNATEPVGDIEIYMTNNTVMDWIERIEGTSDRYNISIRFNDIDMAMYDSFHMVIITRFDIVINDMSSENRYSRQNVRISSLVDISTIEDPLFHMMISERIPTVMRVFKPCQRVFKPNGTIVEQWIESGCYFRAQNSFLSPSFFDRLEGRDTLSGKFILRSRRMFSEVGYTPRDIGLESLVNINLLEEHDVDVDHNLNQVDSAYFRGEGSICSVDGMPNHEGFRISPKHSLAYGIVGLNCRVKILGDSEDISFEPGRIMFAKDTKITFTDHTGVNRQLEISAPEVMDSITVPAWGEESYLFAKSAEYSVTDTVTYEGFQVIISDDVDIY